MGRYWYRSRRKHKLTKDQKSRIAYEELCTELQSKGLLGNGNRPALSTIYEELLMMCSTKTNKN